MIKMGGQRNIWGLAYLRTLSNATKCNVNVSNRMPVVPRHVSSPLTKPAREPIRSKRTNHVTVDKELQKKRKFRKKHAWLRNRSINLNSMLDNLVNNLFRIEIERENVVSGLINMQNIVPNNEIADKGARWARAPLSKLHWGRSWFCVRPGVRRGTGNTAKGAALCAQSQLMSLKLPLKRPTCLTRKISSGSFMGVLIR